MFDDYDIILNIVALCVGPKQLASPKFFQIRTEFCDGGILIILEIQKLSSKGIPSTSQHTDSHPFMCIYRILVAHGSWVKPHVQERARPRSRGSLLGTRHEPCAKNH